MSAFNSLVPLGEDQWSLVDIFDWDRSIGRIRYAWLSSDGKHGYILFKDGPASWSEKKQEVEIAIRTHPAFVSYDVLERDSVYVIATFDLSKTERYSPDLIQAVIEADAQIKEVVENHIALTEHPFDIFDRNMKAWENGTLRADMVKRTGEIAEKIKNAIEKGEGGIIEV
jgi:hypothetical protein